MARKPRILIVTASVGSGHTQAALAIKQALKKKFGCRAPVIDFLSGGGRYLGRIVKSTYLRALKTFPEIWDYVYRYSNRPRYGEPIKSVLQLASERHMAQIIRRYAPDVLVFTHPFPCGAAAGLKKEGKTAIPLVGVITDYAVHRFWEYPEVDHYCVATDELAAEIAAQGFTAAEVSSVGIPVRDMLPSISEEVPAEKIVLVMGGGMGMGPDAEMIRSLTDIPGVSLRVVCGKNIQLYHKLKAFSLRASKLRVYGFTNNIPELMAQSSLLVTKPGGLTASEALAAGLPMVLIDVFGGQEEDNAAFLVENGVALLARSSEELERQVRAVLSSPETLAAMKERCLKLGRPGAAYDVADVIYRVAGEERQ